RDRLQRAGLGPEGARRGRRRLPRAARPVRRGRHAPGPAGAVRDPLRRLRRARLGRRPGPGLHEAGVRLPRAAGRPVRGGPPPRASVPAEIPPVTAHDFYDFEAKYIDSAAGIVPAPLTEEQTARVRELAVAAFEAASCEGLVRADFFLQDNGEFVINEINTLPG